MKGQFADTSFFVAVVNAGDAMHARAQACSEAREGRLVTTDLVQVEFANWLTRWGKRAAFAPVVENLRADPITRIYPATREGFDKGYDLFQRRPDKDWSLTDCISFVVVQEEGVTEALTTDHHFEQAGFTILLKNP
jgi:predicted nucleic acid-binding protein